MPMTDDELAEFLGVAKAKERDAIMRAITPEQRVSYEHMHEVEKALRLYSQGKGPKPSGVIICGELCKHAKDGK